MNFKEMIASDIDAVFLFAEEFAEEKEVNGKKALVIVDDYVLEKHNIEAGNEKISRSEILFYIKSDFFGENIPVAGKMMEYDGDRNYRIDDVKENEGILAIKLGRLKE